MESAISKGVKVMVDNELDYMKEIKATFIEESKESLDRVELLAIDLQIGTSNLEPLNAIYRSIHSIKGNSGYFNFDPVTRLAHQFETLLTQLTQDGRPLTESIKNHLIDGIDVLKKTFSTLNVDSDSIQLTPEDELFIKRINEVCTTSYVRNEISSVKSDATTAKDDWLTKTIRINQDRLDNFMYYIGEILMQKEIFSYIHEKIECKLPNSDESKELKTVLDVLEKNIISLQHCVLSIRKIPISQLFNRYKRLIHDLSASLGKKIVLIFEGESLELDKNIIDLLEAPLTHIIRNSIDHGIETPQARIAQNKKEEGHILLRALTEEQFTVIEIEDDGGGINLEKVQQKALEKQICTKEEFEKMSEEQRFFLIFEAGFSTKEEVSTVSGRGVGMDVVKTAINNLNGKIEIRSKRHQGTTIRLLLQNSSILMTKRTLICQVAEQIFAIPIENVVELQRVNKELIVTTSDAERLYQYHHSMLPLICLQHFLNVSSDQSSQGTSLIVIILTDNKGNEVGCVVNEVIDRKNLVIRKFDQDNEFQTNYFLGSAILGNGQVILVINPESLIRNKY